MGKAPGLGCLESLPLDQGDEFSIRVHRVLLRYLLRPVVYVRVSTIVNIDCGRYSHSALKRQTNADVRLLQAVADPTRLAILRQLSAEGEVCACDFASCCEVAQPTVSHHLKVLREAGWIEGERRGTWIWYAIRPEALERFRSIAGGLIASGEPRPVSPAKALRVLQPKA